jgi:MFS family permease
MRSSTTAIVGPAEYGAIRWVILAIASAALFLGTFDLWVVTIALPALQREFPSTGLSDIAWVLSMYTIVLATVLTPAGRIADGVGRKTAFVIGLALFGTASIGCAFAASLGVMVAWRAVQALGAAIVLPTSLGLALPAFPRHERGTALGVWSAVGAIAAGSGPVIGGFLVEWSWRWIFLVNAPIIVVTIVSALVLLPGGQSRTALRVDGVGMVMALGAMGLVCAALVQAAAWPPAVVLPMIAAGVVVAIGFVYHAKHHPDPLIPPRLFDTRRYRYSAMGMLGYHLGFSVMLLGTTLLLTGGMHLSVLEAAFGLAPGPISAGLASLFSGRIVARFGARRMVVLGAGLFGASGAWPLLMSASGQSVTYALCVLPSLVLWGVANAFIQPTFFGGADAAPHADLSLATGVLAAARQLASALGVALLVGLLAAAGGGEFGGLHFAWIIVCCSAVLTGIAGLRLPEGSR